ncbi:glycosyltransferase [Sphingomonas sp. 2SG]|uniref:glycosyltransferase n=1 Tax=Sphingomonas sp. 2SG TaxID=2502201 RepID=UPI0010F78CD1|nr:glycosyltransferase [Sphingomonas sp. 2SG]
MSHVAIFLPDVEGGGAERVMVTLANGFAVRGHQVDLVLAKARGSYLGEVAGNVRVIDLNKGRVATSILPLAQYLRRERPTALLSALNHANIIAIIAKKLSGVPMRLVVSERNSPLRTLMGGGQVAIFRALTRCLYPATDGIICVAKGIQDELEHLLGLPPEKLHTVYNPLDLSRIESLKADVPDHVWFRQHQSPVIVAAGRLTAQKDYPTLLRAFQHLRRTRDAKLIVLGKGEERAALLQLVDELDIGAHVDFVGFQDNPFAWMAASDLYVMSSAWEGLPGSLLQAMACGTRIVSTDCRTGPAEILENGRWGRLVPVGDSHALGEAMAVALDDPSPPQVTERAHAFGLDRAIDGYARLLAL